MTVDSSFTSGEKPYFVRLKFEDHFSSIVNLHRGPEAKYYEDLST